MVVWGTGQPRRELLHVDDMADACVFLLQNYDSPEIVNVGVRRDFQIRELAELICDVVGFEASDVRSPKPDGTRAAARYLEAHGARLAPKISLREGIAALTSGSANKHAALRAMTQLASASSGRAHREQSRAALREQSPRSPRSTTRSAKAEELARHGVRASSSRAISRAGRCASIATPTSSHFEVARATARRGKHALIEKPIAEILRTRPSSRSSRPSGSSSCRSVTWSGFNPVLSALEQRLTHPRFIEAHRLSPYPNRSTEIGVVLDLMIHDLEIILHLVRSPVQTIDAVGVPVLSRGEDIANARIRFEDGCVANITSSRSARADAEDPCLPGGRVSLSRLPNAERRDVSQDGYGNRARGGGDRARRTAEAPARFFH
jgi:hypothetical protein